MRVLSRTNAGISGVAAGALRPYCHRTALLTTSGSEGIPAHLVSTAFVATVGDGKQASNQAGRKASKEARGQRTNATRNGIARCVPDVRASTASAVFATECTYFRAANASSFEEIFTVTFFACDDLDVGVPLAPELRRRWPATAAPLMPTRNGTAFWLPTLLPWLRCTFTQPPTSLPVVFSSLTEHVAATAQRKKHCCFKPG